MYIECQNCHANNHINTECVNCHAPLDHHTSSKKMSLNHFLKFMMAGVLLMMITLIAYEYHFRDKLFPQIPRHSIVQEYQAIDECINKFYTHNNKLSICSQALEKMQAQHPNTEEINLVMLNAFAQIQSQQP